MEVNVSSFERVASALGGGGLLAYGLKRRTPQGIALALGGAALLAMGATGFCPFYKAAGVDTAHGGLKGLRRLGGERHPLRAVAEQGRAGRQERDLVEEASDESFPASDAPSFTPGKIG